MLALRKIVVIVAVASLGACSFVFTKGPPARSASSSAGAPPPACTTTMTVPILDGVVALVAVLAAAGAADSSRMNASEDTNGTIALGIVVGGVAAASALVGHSRVTKCRRVHDTYVMANYGAGAAVTPPTAAPSDPYAAPAPPRTPTTTSPAPPPTNPTAPQPAGEGTEGDVCATQAECAAGFMCNNNVCLRK
jgi:hypothetical protein